MEQGHIEGKRYLNINVNTCNIDNNLSKTSAAKVAYATVAYKKMVGENVLNSSKVVLKVPPKRN